MPFRYWSCDLGHPNRQLKLKFECVSVENSSMSSSTSCSYPPTSIGVTPLILDLVWVNVVAIKPCPASKGVHPIAELNVVLMANWKDDKYNVLKFLYSWSDSLRIIDPMVWFTLSQIAFPLGLCASGGDLFNVQKLTNDLNCSTH